MRTVTCRSIRPSGSSKKLPLPFTIESSIRLTRSIVGVGLRQSSSANSAEIRNGESSAFHVGWAELFIARLLRKPGQLCRQFHDIFLIHIANHGYQQPAIGIHRDANVDELLVNDFLLLHVDAGVELRKYLQSGSANFQRDGGHGHLAASLLRLRSKAGAQLLELGDVGFVVLGDVRDW